MNKIGVPLYVLIDVGGRIAYAGKGGDNLAELRAALKNLIVSTPP